MKCTGMKQFVGARKWNHQIYFWVDKCVKFNKIRITLNFHHMLTTTNCENWIIRRGSDCSMRLLEMQMQAVSLDMYKLFWVCRLCFVLKTRSFFICCILVMFFSHVYTVANNVVIFITPDVSRRNLFHHADVHAL